MDAAIVLSAIILLLFLTYLLVRVIRGKDDYDTPVSIHLGLLFYTVFGWLLFAVYIIDAFEK